MNGINHKGDEMKVTDYIGVVEAKEGNWLLGAAKRVESTPFETEQMALDWIYAVSNQPNAGKTYVRTQMVSDKMILKV